MKMRQATVAIPTGRLKRPKDDPCVVTYLGAFGRTDRALRQVGCCHRNYLVEVPFALCFKGGICFSERIQV